MSNHDPISDMLTRIRNASQKKHTTTTIPSSKMSLSIAKVLQKEGFISDINEEGEGYKSQIILGLKYSGKDNFPTIRSMQRVSKPGLRIFLYILKPGLLTLCIDRIVGKLSFPLYLRPSIICDL